MNDRQTPTLRELYPHLSDEQLVEVEDSLERYLALVLQIAERVEVQTQSPGSNLTHNCGDVACDS